MAAKKKSRKAAKKVGGKKKSAAKKAGAKRGAGKRANPKKKVAPTRKNKVAAKAKAAPAAAKPAVPKPLAAKPAARPAIASPAPRPAAFVPIAPAGGVSTRDVNRGHLFALQPRVNTSFTPQAFDDARRELSDVRYGTIDEAARAVAERALELSNERPDRDPFPAS